MTGTTKSGFMFTIDERVKTDWDFLKTVNMLKENPNNFMLLDKVLISVLGENGYNGLIEHIKKNNDGFCPVEILSREFIEIINSDNEIKK